MKTKRKRRKHMYIYIYIMYIYIYVSTQVGALWHAPEISSASKFPSKAFEVLACN